MTSTQNASRFARLVIVVNRRKNVYWFWAMRERAFEILFYEHLLVKSRSESISLFDISVTTKDIQSDI